MIKAKWPILRILRLVLAIVCAHGSYVDGNFFMGIVAAILFYQVVTQIGCSGTGSC